MILISKLSEETNLKKSIREANLELGQIKIDIELNRKQFRQFEKDRQSAMNHLNRLDQYGRDGQDECDWVQ